MNFLHPWALAIGIGAIALPILIHWLTKPRPTRMPLSTVRFVRQIMQQKRARYRLRDLLVLLLRGLAIALVALAFARPWDGKKQLIDPNDSSEVVRVVILDVSQSSAAVQGGATLLDRGRIVAADYLKGQSGMKAGLILAGATPETVFPSASTNISAMREAVSAAQPKPQRLDVQPTINRAAELLAQGDPAGKRTLELIIISDFQRSNWAAVDLSALPKATKIQFESTAPQTTLANLAIIGVGIAGRLEQGREATLAVEVGNYSASPRTIEVAVTVGDVPYRLSGVCPPGATTTLNTPIRLSDSGWTSGRAELVSTSDALSADNARSFVLNVRSAPAYALITRESAKPHVSSSHFLERALVPRRSEAIAGERVVRLDPLALDPDALASAAVVVVDHPGKMPPESINTLAGLMRRGRGVLYVAAEPIDATNLRLIADAAGADLKMPVEFVPPAPTAGPRRELFLVDWKMDQAPFAELRETATALLSPLRFGGGLSSRRLEGGLMDDVLATYSDQSASLIVTACGAGSLAVLNADLTQSSLITSSVFVPIVSELCGRLLASRNSNAAAPCGERLAAYLPPEVATAQGLSLRKASEIPATDLGELSEVSGGVVWRWEQAGEPGIYEVKRDTTTLYAAATAIPAVESDLSTLTPDVLTTRLAGGRAVAFSQAGEQSPADTAWTWLLVAVCGCVVGELLLLRAFKT